MCVEKQQQQQKNSNLNCCTRRLRNSNVFTRLLQSMCKNLNCYYYNHSKYFYNDFALIYNNDESKSSFTENTLL